MTPHHDVALALAVLLVAACLFGTRCDPQMFDKVQNLAMTIVIATFAHAGAAKLGGTSKRNDQQQPDAPAGDSNPGTRRHRE